MKRILFFIALVLLVFTSTIKGQEKTIRLFPESGKKYLYKFTKITYIQNTDGDKRRELIRTKLLSIEFATFQPENRAYLLVKVNRNIVEKPDPDIINFKDYRFPDFSDGFYERRNSDFYEELLCFIDFKYNFDFKTGNVKLANREEVLFKAREVLQKKGFDEYEVRERTANFNNEAIPKISKYLKSIYQVSQSNFEDDFQKKGETKTSTNDSVLVVIQKKGKMEAGLYLRSFSVDKRNHNLLNYHAIQLDSIKGNSRFKGENYPFSTVEKEIQLIRVEPVGLKRFTISGKIENPMSKTVTLARLKNPFGVEMQLKTVFLDGNNSFQFDIELEHAEFVYLQFGRINNFDKRPVLTFYARPGSKIRFNAKGNSIPWKMEFSGDLVSASDFLYEVLTKPGIPTSRIDFKTLSNNWYKTSYSDFKKAFNDFKSLSKKYKSQIQEDDFEFITNELTAYFFNGIISFLTGYYFAIHFDYSLPGYKEIGKSEVEELEKTLSYNNIHNIYNENGIQSRLLVSHYLRKTFSKIKKVKVFKSRNYRIGGFNSDFVFSSDITQTVELARAVLAGHALYSEITKLLINFLTIDERYLVQDKTFVYRKVDEYFDLMIRVCNDEEFINSITEVKKKFLKWQNGDYVPNVEFYNEKEEIKKFADFFGEKPTVFYVSLQWAQQRYYWDKLADENPDLNVVMVTEGSNFKEWTDYIEAATPIAKQLILKNGKQSLSDVFMKNSRHYIAYDKTGKLIGFADDADEIIKMAKASLVPKKKEFDKSQLQIIIIILFSILIALIAGLLFWKWRVRLRFRKEKQARKLRELELTAIRSQMNPHFLFNSLNSVQNLVQQNKGREAHLYLADFAGMIRKVLRNSEKEEVSLAEELEMVRQYLNLEKLRFEFDFSIEVENGIDPHNTAVPSLLLQPFVENAIIHGLQNKPKNRNLKIEIKQVESGIQINIEDDGIGRAAAAKIAKTKNGKGVKLIEERLAVLQEKQGEKYRLETIDLTGDKTGTRIEIFIPDEI